MNSRDTLIRYVARAPLQLALIRAKEAELFSKIPLTRPVLDIGCADGIFAEVAFGKKGTIDVGIDIDDVALGIAREKKIYRRVVRADARNLPFRDAQFGSVISNQSMEHIKGVDAVFAEVARVLKKRGTFVFLVPTIYLADYWLTSAAFRLIGLTRMGDFFHTLRNRIFHHENLWPASVWKRKLEAHGLTIDTLRYNGTKKNYFVSELLWPLRIPQLLLTRLLGSEVLFPRGPAVFAAKVLSKFLSTDGTAIPASGATMLITAHKT